MGNYDFDAKNKWRRMIWQRITARLKRWNVSTDTAIVLYLSGPDDLDRSVAIKKGFQWNNLIAIDKDQAIIDKLRADGKLAIRSDLVDVLNGWSYKEKPQVIVADFCSNFHESLAVRLVQLYLLGNDTGPFLESNAVLVANFQRGRESINRSADFLLSEPTFAKQFARDFGVDSKHRGLHFLFRLVATIAKMREQYGAVISGINSEDNSIDYAVAAVKSFNPELFTYKGIGGLCMDSIILTRTLVAVERLYTSDFIPTSKELKARRRIAACMALRTTRSQSLQAISN